VSSSSSFSLLLKTAKEIITMRNKTLENTQTLAKERKKARRQPLKPTQFILFKDILPHFKHLSYKYNCLLTNLSKQNVAMFPLFLS
jgi:hypothetical protein